MKYIKEYREEVYVGRAKSITDDHKKFFDYVFSDDFIDIGCKSEIITRTCIDYMEDGSKKSYQQNGYQITIILSNIIKSDKSSIKGLLKYTNDLNGYLLDIESCIKKIKEEYSVSNFIFSTVEKYENLRVSTPYLSGTSYQEYTSNSPFDIVLQLWLH